MLFVLDECGTKEACIAFAEQCGLLPREKICPQHRCPMKIDPKGTVGTFRCHKAQCRYRRIVRSSNTWFENVKISLPTMFRIMLCYAQDIEYYWARVQCSSYKEEVALSEATICDWYNYCRETIVANEIENQENQEQIGGPGRVVQIDESKFGRRKFNRGRQVEGHWVLGMVDEATNELRLEVCPYNVRSAEVLIPIIRKHVKLGTTIHTDFWRAYDSLPAHGYIHKKVNHSESFVAEDGTHTQRIESQWRHLKKRFNKVNYKGNFEDWLIDHQWRHQCRKNHIDPFVSLIRAIKNVFNK